MDTVKKIDNIQKDTLEVVLEEFAGEQKSNTQSLNDLVTAVNYPNRKNGRVREKIE